MVGSIKALVLTSVAIGAALAALILAANSLAAPSSSCTQATRMAKDYLRSQSFSKSGLVDQLEFEGFSHRDAVCGTSHAGANWLTQAVKTAKDYLRSQSFSRSGLIDQLEFEGFSSYQARYGVSRAYH